MTTINLIHHGKALQRFNHNGKTYIVCPDSGDFEVEVSAPTYSARREICISVDGLSVMDGKMATVNTRGYVTSDGKLRLPGWRLDGNRVAKFEFRAAEGSYAASKGMSQNVGCVGVVVFAEQTLPRLVDLVSTTPWPKGGPTVTWSSSTGTGVTLDCSMSSSPTRGASVGAGFGAASSFATTSTTFERGAEISREVVYYRTRQWLRDAEIPVPGEGSPSGEAWPGDVVVCVPPAGWRG